MSISIFDIFKIGIGPSSSHTVGPIKAARQFVQELADSGVLERATRVQTELFGSLGLTGRAHGADKAIKLGLAGETPEHINPDLVPAQLEAIAHTQSITALGRHPLSFVEARDLIFHRKLSLPLHPNGLTFNAFADDESILLKKSYYSIGGGFVLEEDAFAASAHVIKETASVPHDFQTASELLAKANQAGLSIAELIRANEVVLQSDAQVSAQLQKIWQAMDACLLRGLRVDGTLPGGLHVKRRARELCDKLKAEARLNDPLVALDWVSLYAIAVNEENAAGGRVVTAPTNGAAGIIPAVIKSWITHLGGRVGDVDTFLLTAGAIGILYKMNASISGAEVGCQGEVGVACSMAAAGLAAVMGGTNEQIENAAEIGMEHNLGLTCDPVGGLVQIPCIERNAMGAVKAINAARIALRGDGQHKISLDKVIKTMRDTGRDMQSQYKETSEGGLAANYIEC